MRPPSVAEFRPEEILRALSDQRVEYVLIGGLAAAVHGSPLLTTDVDITPEASRENLARLSDALRDLDARVRSRDLDEALPFNHDADSLAAAQVWNLSTRAGDLDISFVPSGTLGFADLSRDAVPVAIHGITVRLSSLADVVRSKEAAGRDKDRRSLPVLREILARRLHEGERP